MKRWSALIVLLAFAGALALRLPRLDTRPLHNDEAVNAVKVAELWQQGQYRYDPDEYHGPTLHYATAPLLALSGAKTPAEVNDGTLRLATVFFGAGLILLLFLIADGIGQIALVWSAIFIAISPAMVFYSRYFIHEMLLIFFTALTLGAAWRYTQKRSRLWATVSGVGLGLMFATKETFVISVAGMGFATFVTWWFFTSKPKSLRATAAALPWKDLLAAFGATFLVWLLFFSSFFTNFHGLLDSVLTYFPWLKRAAGHSPHIHPWYFYLQRLAWFHPVKGPGWTEGIILLLALIGAASALIGRRSPLLFFLTAYTLFLTAAYSTISYKTPWCLLNFFFGMILLAGVGAATLLSAVRSRAAQIALTILFFTGSVHLGVQAWRGAFVYSTDRRNPYVYAQTVPDIRNLVERVEGVARSSPGGHATVLKVIAPENDYWPLPWYFRQFKNVGWYKKVPADPFAPIIVISSDFDARLDDKSERKWIMAGITELRPGKFFELYVELELWKKFVETLPAQED